MSIQSFFSKLFSRVKAAVGAAEGSAFVKITEADAKALEAKGRVVAIDAANEAKAKLVAFYEKEAARVHADADKVKADFDAILAKL